ncbi:hypothetical protein BRAS3843_1640014 [Bradyrhizobium sp. STM 3843]|nr:hypothetical protein BRAS3843_1640014 [Bradyrhizobium sp. STM 3843]
MGGHPPTLNLASPYLAARSSQNPFNQALWIITATPFYASNTNYSSILETPFGVLTTRTGLLSNSGTEVLRQSSPNLDSNSR